MLNTVYWLDLSYLIDVAMKIKFSQAEEGKKVCCATLILVVEAHK